MTTKQKSYVQPVGPGFPYRQHKPLDGRSLIHMSPTSSWKNLECCSITCRIFPLLAIVMLVITYALLMAQTVPPYTPSSIPDDTSPRKEDPGVIYRQRVKGTIGFLKILFASLTPLLLIFISGVFYCCGIATHFQRGYESVKREGYNGEGERTESESSLAPSWTDCWCLPCDCCTATNDNGYTRAYSRPYTIDDE